MSPSTDVNGQNQAVINSFRAGGGSVGGPYAGANLLLLHTTGARTGRERINPLMYQDLGDGTDAVFAAKGGAPTHPDWYRNLVADPYVTAEIGTRTRPFRARTAVGDERTRIWNKQKEDNPFVTDMEARTDREIPVVILVPA
jgi:deazaflavin-dependent oxidoreductase (nitroreductase family)